ncbi:MAG: asparaginase [Microbacteriaceae bacterium]|nr:asparaginase [Microbacteriaceae bacterium]
MRDNCGTFAVSEAVELATVTRGGFVESRHAGTAIVLDPAGNTLVSLGNPDAAVLTRSALKPLQSLAMQVAGLELSDPRHLAMSFASHTGTPAHVSLVQQMLAAGRLSEAHLLCPPSWPADSEARNHLVRHAGAVSALQHACSGKHAAMLLTCLAAAWPVQDYTHRDHPLQQHIFDNVQRLTGETPSHISIDGCGVPVLGMSLAALARGYRRMANASPESPFPFNRQMAGILAAGRAYPQLVEGPSGHDSIVMQHAPVFAKFGAEGVSAMAAADGTVAVVKILDGSSRVSRAVALALLTYAGAVTKQQFAAALKALPLSVLGGREKVGDIRVSIPDLTSKK